VVLPGLPPDAILIVTVTGEITHEITEVLPDLLPGGFWMTVIGEITHEITVVPGLLLGDLGKIPIKKDPDLDQELDMKIEDGVVIV